MLDDELLDRLQRGAFGYFVDETNPANDLVADLLLAGVLTAASYFTEATSTEAEIRALARELYDRIDWDWARNGKVTVAQGWKPDTGFLHYGWQGYNEGALLYVLGLASPSHPLRATSYAAWTATYQWERIYESDVLSAGPPPRGLQRKQRSVEAQESRSSSAIWWAAPA